MSLTRLQIETVLVGTDKISGRVGRKMTLDNLQLYNPSTATLGAIPALSDPIAEALGSLGLITIDPSNVVDADLVAVAGSKVRQVLDIAEFRCLETVASNWNQFDQTKGVDQQMLGKMLDSLLKQIADMRAAIKLKYGIGVGIVAPGGVSLPPKRQAPWPLGTTGLPGSEFG